MNDLLTPEVLLGLPVIVFSLTVHEFSHAWCARQGGDDTATHLGRLTLNPIAHIDPVGTIVLPLIAALSGIPVIGWAKPVPVNPVRLRRQAWMAYVALAGPISNVLIALTVMLALKFWTLAAGHHDFSDLYHDDGMGDVAQAIAKLGWLAIIINIGLAIFNMIPVPPLDGSRVLFHYVINGRPELYNFWDNLERYGFIVLYMIIILQPTKKALGWLIHSAVGLVMAFLG